MQAFDEQLKSSKSFFTTNGQKYNQQQIDTAWEAMGGKQTGYISIAQFIKVFK